MARILLMDVTEAPNNHRVLAEHSFKVAGEITPENFKETVIKAWSATDQEGKSRIIYQALILGSKCHIEAKLYQVKRDRLTLSGKPRYRIFSAFHIPHGTDLQNNAKLPGFYQTTGKDYPSQPALRDGVRSNIVGSKFKYAGHVITIVD